MAEVSLVFKATVVLAAALLAARVATLAESRRPLRSRASPTSRYIENTKRW